MIKLYAKQVPAEDGSNHKDTLIARDPLFTDIKVRWPWYKPNRPVARKQITLNCYEWELVWVNAIPSAGVGYVVDIVESETGRIVDRISPPTGKNRAEKVEAGVEINLDHENFHTEIVYLDGTGREYRPEY